MTADAENLETKSGGEAAVPPHLQHDAKASGPDRKRPGKKMWASTLATGIPIVAYEILRSVLFPEITAAGTHFITAALLAFPCAFALYRLWVPVQTASYSATGVAEADLESAAVESYMPQGVDLLNGLIQASPVAIAVADRNHRIRLTNPAFFTIFGYTLRDCLGKRVQDLIIPESELGKISGECRNRDYGRYSARRVEA